VVRVTEVKATLFNCEDHDEEETDKDGAGAGDITALPDDFRGWIGPLTAVYLDSPTATSRLQLVHCPILFNPNNSGAAMNPRVVQIFTSDGKVIIY
jgi:hypothetical protein